MEVRTDGKCMVLAGRQLQVTGRAGPCSFFVVFRNNMLTSSQKERRPYERPSCFAYDGLNFKQMKLRSEKVKPTMP
jgi:hypothetical protein